MAEGIRSVVGSMQTLWQHHEVLANDLANLSTTGFKHDDLVRTTTGLVPWTDFSQGSVHATGRRLDVALDGPGFFVVETPAGPHYTRAAALDVSRDGQVTAAGRPVLGARGPIAVRTATVAITEQGEVIEGGQTVDTLRIVDFPAPYRLVKEGANLFAPASASVRLYEATQRAVQALDGAERQATRDIGSLT